MITKLIFLVAMTTPLRGDIKILDTPSHQTGPEPCARICSGVSWYDDTGDYSWEQTGYLPGKLYKLNNITDCGFTTKPVVVATTGSGIGDMCPSLSVYYIDKNKFHVYTVEDVTLAEIKEKQCSVYWTASGFTC